MSDALELLKKARKRQHFRRGYSDVLGSGDVSVAHYRAMMKLKGEDALVYTRGREAAEQGTSAKDAWETTWEEIEALRDAADVDVADGDEAEADAADSDDADQDPADEDHGYPVQSLTYDPASFDPADVDEDDEDQ